MPLLTTTIGAYPKPDCVLVPDWFRDEAGPDTRNPTKGYLGALARMGEEAEELFARGVKQVVDDQVEAGIDVPTDGEVPRDCRGCGRGSTRYLESENSRNYRPLQSRL